MALMTPQPGKEQFHHIIAAVHSELQRAATDSGVDLTPDAFAFLIGALVQPETTEVSVGDDLYGSALSAFQEIRSSMRNDLRPIDMQGIAEFYWRLPPPWGKAR